MFPIIQSLIILPLFGRLAHFVMTCSGSIWSVKSFSHDNVIKLWSLPWHVVLRRRVLISLSFEKLRSLEADVTGAVRTSFKHRNVSGNSSLNSKQKFKALWIVAMSCFDLKQCFRKTCSSSEASSGLELGGNKSISNDKSLEKISLPYGGFSKVTVRSMILNATFKLSWSNSIWASSTCRNSFL